MTNKIFEGMSITKQRILIGKVRNMMDANYQQNDIVELIIKREKVSKELVLECINIVITAKQNEESK